MLQFFAVQFIGYDLVEYIDFGREVFVTYTSCISLVSYKCIAHSTRNCNCTGISSNHWTCLSILIGSGNLYPALQDTERSCRAILHAA
jgi:hypothetical protein